ncbi:MAG: PpiC-type peptidyl-prolyl cis-trans isomerase [Proteobacteria bacterium]|nr:PpiC-type peptidyl-prolyl cis-trans isomerase [Pseudomonadota bacterium]
MPTATPVTPASINGVNINTAEEKLSADELRQRACSELLRQAALAKGLLPASDLASGDGIMSEAASHAIDTLLEQTIVTPDPSDDECRRHYAAHQASYSTGERVNARHILFAVTDGVDIVALRKRAETTLLDVRCHDGSEDKFALAASTQSNCPSGGEGGNLGWLSAADCAPEFAKEIFGHAEVGVLPRLVHSRFGFHVVEVLARQPGVDQPFDAVRGAVIMAMHQKAYVTALRHYLQQLAAEAAIVGIDLETADTPLLQ